MSIWKRKKEVEPSREATIALLIAESGLEAAKSVSKEAQGIADRLFYSREKNHYAERIREAYALEQRP